MINLHKSYVAEQGFKLGNPGSAVRYASDSTMEPGFWGIYQKQSEVGQID